MNRKVRDEEEKNPTKKKSSSGWHYHILIRVHPLQRRFVDSGRNADSRDCEFVFGDYLRVKMRLLFLQVLLIFWNKNWTAAVTYSQKG